jgi:glycosyltransferase involved in cell wall biosynthesis
VAVDQARRCRGLFVPRNCLFVRNAVDFEVFSAVPPRTDSKPRILAVGSLLPVKRWDRLLSAALELKRRGLDFLIQIAGNGALRCDFEIEARRLDITDRVELLGHRHDIPQLLADSRFLVHTSDSEGCPNVIAEAMACGRPVIATSVGDIPHIVINDGNGLLVRPGDDAGLVESMARLLVNPDLCWRMGMVGRALAEREFGLHRLVNETLSAYQTAGWKNPL